MLHVSKGDDIVTKPKPFLGIIMSPVTGEYSDDCDKFIKITGIIDESPASKAGLKENDIIMSMNDKPVCGAGDEILAGLRKLIQRQKVNSTAVISVMRNGQSHSLSAKLKERSYIRQPEAEHENIASCPVGPSIFEEGLIKQEKLSLFHEISYELRSRSNLLHNPGWLKDNIANPYQLDEFTYMIRHPLNSGEVAGEMSEDIMTVSEDGRGKIAGVIDRLSHLLDISNHVSECESFILSDLIKLIEKAKKDIDEALSDLSSDEISLIREHVLNPWKDDRWNKILDLSVKIKLKKIIQSIYPLASCLTEENLSLLKKDIEITGKEKVEANTREIEASFGKVLIGGRESNTYKEDAAVILDLGGNDIYLNNAGATRKGMPLSIVIDWDGDDFYLSGENFSQGAGVLGGGFLIDLGGNDIFKAMDGAQGTGLYGVGLLYNRGQKSTFIAKTYSQGVGQFGIGLLWNAEEGNSVYQSSGYGQALGFFNGAGILLDESGNDYYFLGGSIPDFRDPERSTVSMGQGFGKGIMPDNNLNGVSGGIGILIDRRGDDIYSADYFAQGASYYYGIGILDDSSGNDEYFAGRYAQGAGIHSSVGILIDRSGDDSYHASHGVAQGMGHDFGVGYLEDVQGNDRYFGGTLTQGSATYGGIGIIIDKQGQDIYTVKEKSQAFADDEECMGIMLDLDNDSDALSSHSDNQSLRLGIKHKGQ